VRGRKGRESERREREREIEMRERENERSKVQKNNISKLTFRFELSFPTWEKLSNTFRNFWASFGRSGPI